MRAMARRIPMTRGHASRHHGGPQTKGRFQAGEKNRAFICHKKREKG